MNSRDDRHTPAEAGRTSRREFLQQATGLAATTALGFGMADAAESTPTLLPTIALGPHRVTRLIIGGNPIYGHSHFNRILSQYQTTWHTPERVVALIRHAEAQGINTWQNSYAERTIADLERYRAAGGKMHWLCLGKPDWQTNPGAIELAAKHKPIGIAPHGALAEHLHRENKLPLLQDFLKRIRDTGVLVGLSAHNPALIALAEEKGWDVDYYMCCLYYLTRPRAEFDRLLNSEVPLGEIYLASDPPRMFKVVQQTRKPCLVYKVLAAGRQIDSAAHIRYAFETAFRQIKPTDAVIVGMYNQFTDQVAENAKLVGELCAKLGRAAAMK